MADIRLEEAIIQTKAKMVVLDPIQGFLGAEVDMHRANEIRPLMKRIAVLAEKYHCAIILIGHMNKNSNGKSSYRGLGSIDFQAAARSVLIVGRIKEEPETRVVCHTTVCQYLKQKFFCFPAFLPFTIPTEQFICTDVIFSNPFKSVVLIQSESNGFSFWC